MVTAPTKRRPASHLRARLGAVASALEALVGEPATLVAGEPPEDRERALDALPTKLYKAETVITHGDEPRVGFLLPHDAVIAIGASMLMMPDPPDEVTEDIAAGFEEAFNIAVGAWNDGAKPSMRWGSAVEQRQVGDVPHEALASLMEGDDLELLPVDMTLGGATFRLHLFGPARLLFKEQAEAFAASQSDEPAASGGPSGPEVGQAVEVAGATPPDPAPQPEPARPAAPAEEPPSEPQPLSPQADAGGAPASASQAVSAQADAGGAPASASQAMSAQADAGGAPASASQAMNAQADGAPVAPEPPPSRSPTPAPPARPNAPPPGAVVSGASSAPAAAGPAAVAGGPAQPLAAEVLLVDPEGVLRAFIVSKIRSGEIRVYRGTGAVPAMGPSAAAILIRPTAELVAAVRADRTVVVRGARTRAAGPDARGDVEIAAA